MKKVGFITSPLNSSHAVRGVGFYTKNLLDHIRVQSAKFDLEISPISAPSAGYDLIHYPYFDLFFHSLPISRPVKTVVTVHDVVPLEFPSVYRPGPKGLANLLLQRAALSKADTIITDSMASLTSIKKYLHIPDSKIKLIYLAPSPVFRQIKNPVRIKSVTHKYSLPPTFVLYVGDVNWNKNLPVLIKACMSQDLHLVLVGKQAEAIQNLDTHHPELRHLEQIKPYLNSPYIHRLGFVPESDLIGIYNSATVYCQPSLAEGFGLPVLEAMACGLPVVSSNSHSLPEIVGKAGILFDPHDEYLLATILKKVVTESGLRSQLAQSGLSWVKQFTWNKTAKLTLMAYVGCL